MSFETGLLTIGPRFGGAIDDAARYFKGAYDKVRFLYVNNKKEIQLPWLLHILRCGFNALSFQGLAPYEFVESMKKKGIRVPGIGHRLEEFLFSSFS